MSAALKLYDKPLGGREVFVTELKLVSQRITARDLIAKRIEEEAAALAQEYKDSTALPRHLQAMLVAPGFIETALNGKRDYGLARQTGYVPADTKAQIAAACAAFEKSRFLIVLDNRQVTSLDEELTLREGSAVTFIKLVPLVGG